MDGLTVVMDLGKTLSKLTLWTPDGQCLERVTRPNERIQVAHAFVLDVEGIERWLIESLKSFVRLGPVARIIPVGHGAAAVVVRDGRLACPVIDYETNLPASELEAYRAGRDAFDLTGSPALPSGLNLGAQLHLIEWLYPDALAPGAQILLWPQYWAWRLCGVAAAEATSLGCHTDLWNPVAGAPSPMAEARGWAGALPPLRHAGDVLGPISAQMAAATGLSQSVAVHCGLHDSNAALVAARGFPQIAGHEATILSTGTWFVAMRLLGAGADVPLGKMTAGRDCLINVDVAGRPVPSARFMGGREIETLTGIDTRRIDIVPDQPALVAAVPRVLTDGAMVLPSFAPGFGPYPNAAGQWLARPEDDHERRAAVCLYAALVADTALGLIGASNALLVEGRFAEAQVFVRALASLRPDMQVYVAHAHNDVSFGALRLIDPALTPSSSLIRVAPLDVDITAYRAAWHAHVAAQEAQA